MSKPLKGQAVGEHKFQSTSTLNQLEDYGLSRPTDVEGRKSDRPRDEDARRLRLDIQRTFDAARRARADVYSGYIEATEVYSRAGGTPAITLYHPDQLDVKDGDLMIPYSAVLIAIDGETQTEARYILRERNRETGNNPVAITVYHGISYSAARQILHDYNSYSKPIPETKLAQFSFEGPITKAVNEAINQAGVELSNINLKGQLPTKSKKHHASMQQLISGIAGYQLNGRALDSEITAAMMRVLNDPSGEAVPKAGIDALTVWLSLCANNETVRNSGKWIWQIAGAKVSQGRDPNQINWSAGISSLNSTRVPGQGGKKLSKKDRIAAIAAVI